MTTCACRQLVLFSEVSVMRRYPTFGARRAVALVSIRAVDAAAARHTRTASAFVYVRCARDAPETIGARARVHAVAGDARSTVRTRDAVARSERHLAMAAHEADCAVALEVVGDWPAGGAVLTRRSSQAVVGDVHA